ncbi:unnamed protein product, partial [Ascophyllum nodosum]
YGRKSCCSGDCQGRDGRRTVFSRLRGDLCHARAVTHSLGARGSRHKTEVPRPLPGKPLPVRHSPTG